MVLSSYARLKSGSRLAHTPEWVRCMDALMPMFSSLTAIGHWQIKMTFIDDYMCCAEKPLLLVRPAREPHLELLAASSDLAISSCMFF